MIRIRSSKERKFKEIEMGEVFRHQGYLCLRVGIKKDGVSYPNDGAVNLQTGEIIDYIEPDRYVSHYNDTELII